MELDYPELPQIDADSSELREIETRNICVSCQEITTDLFKCSGWKLDVKGDDANAEAIILFAIADVITV